MKPEQLNWSDFEWAMHLNCTARKVQAIKKLVTENYFPCIVKNNETGKYAFHLSRLDKTPSGAERVLPMMTGKTEFATEAEAIKNANEVIIPDLEFNPIVAWKNEIPRRAIQMLHIYEKQK